MLLSFMRSFYNRSVRRSLQEEIKSSKPPKSPANTFVFESLEPRLLLAADPLGLTASSAFIHNAVGNATALSATVGVTTAATTEQSTTNATNSLATITNQNGTNTALPVLNDFSGDGHPDILWRNANGQIGASNNDTSGGNLIYNYYAISQPASGNPTKWVSGSNFTLLDADIAWNTNQGFPKASQYFVQTTAAPINPSITTTGDTSDRFNGVAVALKAASAGTPAPAGIHINKIIHETDAAFPAPATWTLQLPATGNLRVPALPAGANLTNITSITDSDGGVWTKIEPSADEPQIWYSANRTPDPNLVVTLHIGGSSFTPTMTAVFYDISGAAANPFDVAAGAPSTDVSNKTMINNFPSITPTTANGLVIAVMADGDGPGLGLNTGAPTGAVFDLVTYTGETDLDLMENADGQAHLYNSTTATENWNWIFTANSNNSVSASAVAFKSAL